MMYHCTDTASTDADTGTDAERRLGQSTRAKGAERGGREDTYVALEERLLLTRTARLSSFAGGCVFRRETHVLQIRRQGPIHLGRHRLAFGLIADANTGLELHCVLDL